MDADGNLTLTQAAGVMMSNVPKGANNQATSPSASSGRSQSRDGKKFSGGKGKGQPSFGKQSGGGNFESEGEGLRPCRFCNGHHKDSQCKSELAKTHYNPKGKGSPKGTGSFRSRRDYKDDGKKVRFADQKIDKSGDPPQPCKYCSGNHWQRDCTSAAAQTAREEYRARRQGKGKKSGNMAVKIMDSIEDINPVVEIDESNCAKLTDNHVLIGNPSGECFQLALCALQWLLTTCPLAHRPPPTSRA
jgi:hypothetical protein